jgi:Spy/CpxP family protein refolding chaperone
MRGKGASANEHCRAIKPNGERCSLPAQGSNGFCWAHSPENAEQRQRIARRGGVARGARSQVARDIRADLQRMAAAVEKDELDAKKAAVAGQLLNYALGSLKVKRDLVETEDLIEEFRELQQHVQRIQEAKRG